MVGDEGSDQKGAEIEDPLVTLVFWDWSPVAIVPLPVRVWEWEPQGGKRRRGCHPQSSWVLWQRQRRALDAGYETSVVNWMASWSHPVALRGGHH